MALFFHVPLEKMMRQALVDAVKKILAAVTLPFRLSPHEVRMSDAERAELDYTDGLISADERDFRASGAHNR
jgi:hypothetical protein